MHTPHSSLSHFQHDPHTLTWHEYTNWKTTIKKSPFDIFPTELIPHPLYQTINSSAEQEWHGEMDVLTLTDNNEFPAVCTDTPTPTPTPTPQPPSSYCLPQSYSYTATTPYCPGSAVQPPTRREQQRHSEKQKLRRLWAQMEILEWDLGQSAAGCSLKVKLKVEQGQR